MRTLMMTSVLTCIASLASAQHIGTNIVLGSVADATLIGTLSGGGTPLSSGGGTRVYVGRTGNNSPNNLRRALIRFDLSNLNIPASGQIIGVSLKLVGGGVSATLRKVLEDWGEGTNPGTSGGAGGGGAGDPAQVGDATWDFAFYPNTPWTVGFDFSTASAMSQTQVSGVSNFWSTEQMRIDVEGWVNDPSTNFGWLLHADELNIAAGSISTYGSRETTNPAHLPELTVTWAIRPGSQEDFALSGGVNGTLNYDSVIQAAPGDALTLQLESPQGGYVGTPHFLCGQIYTNGFPPFRSPFYPELFLDFTPGLASPVVYVFSAYAPMGGPASLPAGGHSFNFTVPPGLAGLSSMVQGYAQAPSAKTGNPWFTATHATRIRFL